MSGKFDEKRVVNGSFGELWIDGMQIAEITSIEAMITIDREDIAIAGQLEKGTKITGMKGTGSFTLKKTFSRFQDFFKGIKLGKDIAFMMIIKLDDPDSYGAERFIANGCKFEGDFPLINFENNSMVSQDFSFMFKPSDSEFVDLIIDSAMI